MFGLLLQLNLRKLCQLNLGRRCCVVTRTKGHSESGVRVLFFLLLTVVFALGPSKSKDGLESIPVMSGPMGGARAASSVPAGAPFPSFHLLCSVQIPLRITAGLNITW